MRYLIQGIYSYKGINNWNKLNQIVFDNKASIEYLKESYRTSMEIMNEANTIINKIVDNENIILAQPIERHGDKVEHWEIDSEDSKMAVVNTAEQSTQKEHGFTPRFGHKKD